MMGSREMERAQRGGGVTEERWWPDEVVVDGKAELLWVASDKLMEEGGGA